MPGPVWWFACSLSAMATLVVFVLSALAPLVASPDGERQWASGQLPPGVVWAWGSNIADQLGNVTTTYGGNPTPLRAGELSDVVAVAAGSDFGLALKKDGSVWAWGDNRYGELGGGSGPRGAAVRVRGLSRIRAIAAGGGHSLALRDDGTVWAWGNNCCGQIGADGGNSPTPLRVNGLADVVAVAAGSLFSLALRADGTVWAWGANESGQLGRGVFDTYPSPGRPTPAPVQGLSGVTAIAAGTTHALALKPDGTAWAWGNNRFGQLGDGSTATSALPVQVQGLASVVALAGGSSHSLALRADGTVWAWGWNSYGQLGNGSVASSPYPAQVRGLRDVVAISAGGFLDTLYVSAGHSLALRRDGTLWSWGANRSGQLGSGVTNRIPNMLPTEVRGLRGVTAMAAGGSFSLAMTPLTVRVANGAFQPPELSVQAGDTVTWVNADTMAYATVAEQGAWDSGTLLPGQSFSRAFPLAGSYSYSCPLHPGLRGRVAVSKAPYTRVEDDSEQITYAGQWKQQRQNQASHGGISFSNDPEGSSASFTWTGTDLAVLMVTGPEMGMASIVVDGDQAGQLVDLYSPAVQFEQRVFVLQDLPLGAHQVTIAPVHQHNTRSRGYTVALDALEAR